MNESPSAGSTIDDTALDRLVDGELAADERRDLLARLDRTPDGWRRCALAFVESQTLGDTLGDFVRGGHADASPDTPSDAAPRVVHQAETQRGRGWAAPLAAAAAVLVAFGAGLAVPSVGDSPSASTLSAANQTHPLEERAVERPARGDALLVWAVGGDDGDGGRRAIRAPLMDADAIQKRFGVRFDAGPPADVVREFEDRGYRLSAKRRFAPLFIGGDAQSGGQPIVVPVDDVQVAPIRYVSL